MARNQAMQVTRLEADAAHALLRDSPVPDLEWRALHSKAQAYRASVEEERKLIGNSTETRVYQDREDVMARKMLTLTDGPMTREKLLQLRRLSRQIAAREDDEARLAVTTATANSCASGTMMASAIIAFFILVATAAFVSWRAVVRPLEALAHATRDLAGETWPRPISPSGPSELRSFTEHFNAMASAVERQVERRTVDLAAANRQLAQIDANRRLFLAKVSHALGTPVTVIRGEAEVALRLNDEADGLRQSLRDILDSTNLLQRRLADLLTLARAEDGALPIHREPVDLVALTQRAMLVLAPLALMREASLHLQIPETAVGIDADPERLEQALLAMLDNSLKFTPPGGCVEIEVKVSDHTANLSVRDAGPGVAEDELALIFAPHVQGAAGQRLGGSGLGLALVRWIAQAHGGSVCAENNSNGEGLCVSITLPIRAGASC
ncbi:sensor histidine kinase [Novosphingobium sp. KACC 22771]|uniref:sensor histidine kinase n=1 Tax=Novosphingobium sp. KACC 22771 TaxID=3025670 RepID=UPI002366D81F|nr:HAMP domain-containing sensor histidine kinase [Novosphingobium sp. KACC 22771]WDF70950.1 HAMP domain-containing sensor histidine kinase [Novosphingobium sp. KACC 22771]